MTDQPTLSNEQFWQLYGEPEDTTTPELRSTARKDDLIFSCSAQCAACDRWSDTVPAGQRNICPDCCADCWAREEHRDPTEHPGALRLCAVHAEERELQAGGEDRDA